jgi:hypothetical protein
VLSAELSALCVISFISGKYFSLCHRVGCKCKTCAMCHHLSYKCKTFSFYHHLSSKCKIFFPCVIILVLSEKVFLVSSS